MAEAINTDWDKIEHSLFSTQYTASLAVRDYSGAVLAPNERSCVANWMTRSPETGILRASVEIDPVSEYTECVAVIEAEDEVNALRILADALISGLVKTDKDAECIEYMGFHLADRVQLEQDMAKARADGETLNIHHVRYVKEELPLHDLEAIDPATLPDPEDYDEDSLYVLPHIEAIAVYYQQRNAFILS